jgi:hypothetical protein
MTRLILCSLGLVGLLSLAGAAPVKPLTALKAREIAQKSLSGEVKNNVIQVVGSRSAEAMTPDVWKFVFWDEKASQNGRLVTVSGTSVTEIRDGYFEMDKMRMFAYKTDEIIDPKRLKVDSDKALETVLKTAQLQAVKLSSVIFYLNKVKGLEEPVWKMQILADRNGSEVDIGYARVSAETGGIIEMKLAPEKLKKK